MNVHGMTVADVMTTLQHFKPDAKIVLATDAEGNDFKPLIEIAGDDSGCVVLWPGDK